MLLVQGEGRKQASEKAVVTAEYCPHSTMTLNTSEEIMMSRHTVSRRSSLARAFTLAAPGILLALSGSVANAQPLSWLGGAGPNWFDFVSSGLCNGGASLKVNNFGQTNCTFAPPFPAATNTVTLGSNIVTLNGSTSIAALSLSAGGTLTWTGGDINTNGGVFSNAGTVNNNGVGHSFFNTTLNNSGSFIWTEGTLFFQTLAMNNTGLTEVSSGSWPNWTGTNSYTQTAGTFRKLGPNDFTFSVPMTWSGGAIDAVQGNLIISNNTASFAPSVTWSVALPASVRFRNETINGTITAAPVGFLGSDSNCTIGSGGLTLNVTGAGYQHVGGDIQLAGQTLTNNQLLTISTNNRSFFNGTLANTATGTLRVPDNTTYFQTLAMANAGLIEVSAGSWSNWTGTNSYTQTGGTFRKLTPADMSITVNSIWTAGVVDVQAGNLIIQSAASNFSPATSINVAASAGLRFRNQTIEGRLTSNAAGFLGSDSSITVGASGLALNVTGAGYQHVGGDVQLAGRTLTNNGLMTVSSNNRSFYNGTLANSATGTLRVPDNTTYFQTLAMTNAGLIEVSAGSWPNWTGTNSFLQTGGTFRKLTPADMTFSISSSWTGGAINVQAGNLILQGNDATISPAVTWNVPAGGNVRLRNQAIQGTIQAAPAGFIGADSSWSITNVAGASLTLNVTGAGFQMVGGDLQGNGRTLTNRGLFTTSFNNRSFYNLPFINESGATYTTADSTTYFQGCNFTNRGTINFNGGIWANWTGTNSFTNTGTLTKNSAGNAELSVPTSNSGIFDVATGGFTGMNYTQTAGQTRLPGGTMASSSTQQYQGGTFVGSGNAGPINNSGAAFDLVPPGGGNTATLTLSGPYTQSGTGSLTIDINSDTGFDRIACQGSPNVGGDIIVRIAPGYNVFGKSYLIVTGTGFTPAVCTARVVSVNGTIGKAYVGASGVNIKLGFGCSPADIADGQGNPLPGTGFNPGVDGGDFDCFFNFYFEATPTNAVCDIADGLGDPLPPFGPGTGFNPGVDGGDFDCFFNFYFNGCL